MRRGRPAIAAQRASACIRAVESGPPETAAKIGPQPARSAKRRSKAAASSGAAALCGRRRLTRSARAAGALLLALDALLHGGGGGRVFALELGEGRAGLILGA